MPIPLLDLSRPWAAHLTGIGGSGMRSLAQVLIQKGWQVSGSDRSTQCDGFWKRVGVETVVGHAAINLPADAEIVIHSSAIPADNPELRRAAELGIPIVSYAEMLGQLMQGRRGLAVAGTHGKSTTTAMAAEIFKAADGDPTYIYGAAPRDGGEGGQAGDGPHVLAEACEFGRNFLQLHPHDAVILNIEEDHFECYPTRESLDDAFRRFAALLPPDGTLVLPCTHAGIQAACRVETFGLAEPADWRAIDVQSDRGLYAFDLLHNNCNLGRVELAVYGQHNVFNALAAAALAGLNGCSAEAIISGLRNFHGLRRRLELVSQLDGIAIWDDYAHHPTEISGTLATVRETSPHARVFCLFQPHQALRTARLLDELAASLQNAERVMIADIFRAREGPPRPGDVTAADLAARTRDLGQVVFGSHALEDIKQYLQTQLAAGDVLVVMGAGDIGRTAYGLVDWFRECRAAR